MNLFSLADSAVIFALSSALSVFYVLVVIRKIFFTSRDGQGPTPSAPTSSENDRSHRGPGGTGPLGCARKARLGFA